jgi:hypothetical protein
MTANVATRIKWALVLLTMGGAAVGQAPNDGCFQAAPVFLGLNPGLTNVGCGSETPGTCFTGPDPDAWFKFTATFTGNALFSTCVADGGAATFDTELAVWATGPGCPMDQLCCNNDALGTVQSRCCVAVVADTEYLVSVGGAFGATGTFYLMIAQDCVPPPPATPPCTPPPPQMALWLTFDAPAGAAAIDSCGGPDGAIDPLTTHVVGQVSNGLNFPGGFVNKGVAVPSTAKLNPPAVDVNDPTADDFSVDAWVRAGTSNGTRVIVEKIEVSGH